VLVPEGISREKGVVDVADTTKKRVRKKISDDEIKTSLMNKYGEMFIDKLTPQDLEELQLYLGKQYDKERGWNNEYKQKFESKLRQYFHEEVLRREIASIETLLGLMQRQDLRR
jgi:predicted house-cleaning noncanonical NTP pyrophosphatase (MazG superfamily)